ncbi:DUF1906 domain-containing protein [Antrihabitans cavernicola]|uniref:DUF1906 domain-containing protein n=1 Tax=Antrihabitans cavernicola TaxID=2495913 RepID=A0A5A7SFA2_9NOCA|nr:DUF1906 domain-containing protein [Spelaeibacter cavernicola]KAA0023323.1 DUF1906 domain-containing protein [Spelaeibacter cavernicola]
MRLGLDYAARRPGGTAIRAAGYDFAVRYLSDGGPSLPGKLLTSSEADDLRVNGISIVSNWETTADRMLDGYGAGLYDAEQALSQVLACGGRIDRPIYFSADFDATPAQQVPIDNYLRGAAAVLGVGNVGIYGGYWPVHRALNNGTATWSWQTDAWSGTNVETGRNLHQFARTVRVGGVDCDVNEALTEDFGQWDFQRDQQPTEPAPEELDLTPEQDAMLRDIQVQLRGPNLAGWPQLGNGTNGDYRTLVDGLAAALARIDELEADVEKLSGSSDGPWWQWPWKELRKLTSSVR